MSGSGKKRGGETEPPERLGVRPARLVRRSAEGDERLRGALRALYRDYLAGGGLDCSRRRRCDRRPPTPPGRRRG